MVDGAQRLAPGRRAIVFCVSVAHAKALAAAFGDSGVPSAMWRWGAMTSEQGRGRGMRYAPG